MKVPIYLFTLLFLFSSHSILLAQEDEPVKDPTEVNETIRKILEANRNKHKKRVEEKESQKKEKKSNFPDFKIKAKILQSKNNGLAVLEFEGTTYIVRTGEEFRVFDKIKTSNRKKSERFLVKEMTAEKIEITFADNQEESLILR